MVVLNIAHIVQTPDVCGGKPRIDGTRMRVSDVAINHNSGMTVAEICDEFELSPAQVHAALAYYYDHQAEIDRMITAERDYAERFLADGKAKTSKDLIERVNKKHSAD